MPTPEYDHDAALDRIETDPRFGVLVRSFEGLLEDTGYTVDDMHQAVGAAHAQATVRQGISRYGPAFNLVNKGRK